MNRKRSLAPAGSFKSPLLNQDRECDSPVYKKNFAPNASSMTPTTINRIHSSRFVSPSNFKQPYKMNAVLSPGVSSVKNNIYSKSTRISRSAQQHVPEQSIQSVIRADDSSTFVKPIDASRSRPYEQISTKTNQEIGSSDLQTLDFQTASQAPIKLLTSKLNAARSLLRDVDITENEETENRPLEPKESVQTFPDSLEQDLDVDWASVGKSIEEKLNETL